MLQQKMPPVHPGEILKEMYLDPLGISITDLADNLNYRSATGLGSGEGNPLFVPAVLFFYKTANRSGLALVKDHGIYTRLQQTNIEWQTGAGVIQ